jgi:hypothetical protein
MNDTLWIYKVIDEADFDVIDPGQSPVELLPGIDKEIQVFGIFRRHIHYAPHLRKRSGDPNHVTPGAPPR